MDKYALVYNKAKKLTCTDLERLLCSVHEENCTKRALYMKFNPMKRFRTALLPLNALEIGTQRLKRVKIQT